MSEADFLRDVMNLAHTLGWETLHSRRDPRRRNPLVGSMAIGWPDLTLVRGDRVIFAELKTDDGHPSPDQIRVLDLLGEAAETFIWRPEMWDSIVVELQRD